MNQLPIESSGQEIGRLAGRALTSQMPISWIETSTSGDTDYGIDYMMQIKKSSGEVSFNFFLQLKGTMSPSYSADNQFITIDIQLSTIMYYRGIETAVVLAVVDLKDHGGVWHQCPIYYLILEDDFFSGVEGKESQKTTSVRVPTSNLVTNTLDLLGYFQNRFSEQLAVSGLKKQLSDINIPVAPAVSIITRGLEQKPIYLDSMANPIDAPWVHSPEGSNAAALERCWNLLSSNKILLAERALTTILQRLTNLSDNERAEYHLQMARLLSYKGNKEESRAHALQANQACERPRYKLTYLESLFNSEDEPTPELLKDISDHLDTKTYHSCFLKTKCMAMLGHVDEALALLDLHYPDRIAGRLVILCLGERLADANVLLEQVDQLKFSDMHDEYVFHVVAARRLYFAHFAEDKRDILSVPAHGLVTYNVSDMTRAMKHIDRAWSLARELPHLTNIDQLIDVSIPVSAYFDRLSMLANYIEPFYQERSADQTLARSYSQVLWQQQRFADLIPVIEQITEPDGFDLYMFITAIYMTGRKRDALELLMRHEGKLFEEDNRWSIPALAMGVQWASELLEHKVSQRYSGLLKTSEQGRACLAILECEKRCQDSPERKKEHLMHLHDVYNNTGQPLSIALSLLGFLDPQDEGSARIIIALSDRALSHSELSPEHYRVRAHSFLTTKDWSQAEEIANRKLDNGDNDIGWSLILAACLKAQGRLGESLSVLKKDREFVQLSIPALQFYIELSMTLGLLEDVISEIKTLYAQVTTRQMKVEVLSRLLMVYVQSERYLEDAIFALAEYGQLVDQNDVREEGSFLMVSLTIGRGREDTEEAIAAFQARLQAYTEKFPESPILWKEKVEINTTPEELLKQFQRISGTTDDHVKQSEINTQAIRNGSLPAPFIMRSRLMLGLRDMFALWHAAQTSPPENSEFRIKHALQVPWEMFEHETLHGARFLFDETALLALSEIGALGDVLNATDRCYLLQSTFNAIRDAHTGWAGSMSAAKAGNILTALHAVLPKITLIEPTDELSNGVAFDLYADAVRQTTAMLISDDKYLVSCASHLHGPVITGNSINVIEYLYQKGRIDSAQQAQFVGMFSQLPAIGQVNLRIDYVATIQVHSLPQLLYADFKATPFGYLFENIISAKRDSNEIVFTVLKILQAAQLQRPTHPKVILDLLVATQRYHQLRTVPELAAAWFVYQCINTPASSSVLFIRDDNKGAIWIAYSAIMNELAKSTVPDRELLAQVIQCVRTFRAETRARVSAAVESCIAYDSKLLQLMRSLTAEFELCLRLLQTQEHVI
ncbi:DUF4365 domain-containing protein [Rheinheimera muenzenbergensis]|uniref:DUF4365 domain-containing protein n=1 Tax=Rheinheimera muenzenbergensis TaxID=1193628 RepID=A0ABU8C7W1_9GAMM